MQNWTVNDIPPQTGKLAIVTGAAGGLGYEIALRLAHAGAEVVLAGRNWEKGRVAVDRITRALPAAKACFQSLDLASLASVRAFAVEMVTKGPHISSRSWRTCCSPLSCRGEAMRMDGD
jgi:NAD(P)-dependent dehydrogenase (short-subunit alcohol dehydrogenase family)